jgi:hypothetical protein
MGIRKNQNKLTAAEKARFVAAVRKMKTDGAAPYNYDKFVLIHNAAFTGDPNTNPAHLGPAFFPWHRHFLVKFERDLVAADRALGGDGNVTLPYWDWTHDNEGDPGKQRGWIWKDDFMGGFGRPVTTGPFRAGQWPLVPSGNLVRALGRTSIDLNASPSLPDKAQVDAALALEGFDCLPFGDSAAAGPALAAPPPPVLGGASSGALPAGIYRVAITYVNARGETRPSGETVVCLGGGCTPANTSSAITVQSPPPRPSATGFNVYVTAPDGVSLTGTRFGGVTPIGTAATITVVAPGAPRPVVNTTGSFRNVLEGWIGAAPGASPPLIHNRVHMWVGGSMTPGTSPNDPVFFLHHCNVDRLWALWQFRHPGQNYPLTVPNVGGAPGTRPHGLNDAMPPWTAAPELVRPIDVLHHPSLGYTYDTDPPGVAVDVRP